MITKQKNTVHSRNTADESPVKADTKKMIAMKVGSETCCDAISKPGMSEKPPSSCKSSFPSEISDKLSL